MGKVIVGTIGIPEINVDIEDGMTSDVMIYNATKIESYISDAPPNAWPKIQDVIFNPPATIVFWDDDTKTVVKCREGDRFDKETGLAMAVMKKLYDGKHHKIFKRWCKDETN